MQSGKFNILLDSSHGSSGKGAASTRLIDIHRVENASSNNYPNAGHTAIVNGTKFLSKSLPTSAVLRLHRSTYPNLWIGPGSGFFHEQITKEFKQTNYNPDENDVFIHERAVVLSQRHIDAECPTGSLSTEYISSTMSGAGAALTEKIMRRKETVLARNLYRTMTPHEFAIGIRDRLAAGATFMHEVSQGYALSIDYGTEYPYCTSRNCTAQQAMADMMILPKDLGDVYLNVRSFPIRVGNNFREIDGKRTQTGYSGGWCHDQIETTWQEIGEKAEMPQDEIDKLAEKELSSVTRKLRRTATQSWSLLRESAIMNGATKMILNFPQYIHWSCHNVRGGNAEFSKLHPKIREYVDNMEENTNLKVVMLGTGADHESYIYRD